MLEDVKIVVNLTAKELFAAVALDRMLARSSLTYPPRSLAADVAEVVKELCKELDEKGAGE